MAFTDDNITPICNLMVYGEIIIPKDDWDETFGQIFYDIYETILGQIEMPLVPICVDHDKRRIYIDKKFLAKADKQKFALYSSMVERRLRQYDDSVDDDDDDDDLPSSSEEDINDEIPELPYCFEDDEYVRAGIDHLFGRLSHDFMPDDYGLIGNRAELMVAEIENVLNEYALPFFAIEYGPTGVPYFKGDLAEIALMLRLYKEREAEIAAADIVFDKESERFQEAIESTGLPEEELEMLTNKQMGDTSDKKMNLWQNLFKKWEAENEQYEFKTALVDEDDAAQKEAYKELNASIENDVANGRTPDTERTPMYKNNKDTLLVSNSIQPQDFSGKEKVLKDYRKGLDSRSPEFFN